MDCPIRSVRRCAARHDSAGAALVSGQEGSCAAGQHAADGRNPRTDSPRKRQRRRLLSYERNSWIDTWMLEGDGAVSLYLLAGECVCEPAAEDAARLSRRAQGSAL